MLSQLALAQRNLLLLASLPERFSGDLLAALPAFRLGPARVTRRACADLPAEGRFFAALGAVTMAAVQGDTLTLSAPGGPEMIFARVQP